MHTVVLRVVLFVVAVVVLVVVVFDFPVVVVLVTGFVDRFVVDRFVVDRFVVVRSVVNPFGAIGSCLRMSDFCDVIQIWSKSSLGEAESNSSSDSP